MGIEQFIVLAEMQSVWGCFDLGSDFVESFEKVESLFIGFYVLSITNTPHKSIYYGNAKYGFVYSRTHKMFLYRLVLVPLV